MKAKTKICVLIRDKELPYSETFIKAHVEFLPACTLSYFSLPLEANNINFKKQIIIISWMLKALIVLKNLIKGWRVLRFIKKHNVEVLLAEYSISGVRAMKFCEKYNIPLIVHFHGYDAYRKDILEMYRNDYVKLFSVAKAIIVVSKDMEQQIIRLGADPSKVFYNVYGVNVEKFKKANIENSPRQLIAVGRFVDKKAPYLTILAFQKALEAVPDAKLIMVGSGALFETCLNIIKSLKLDKNIQIYNALSHEKVAELMQGSRAFIQHSLMPSSGDSEGTPNTILEAQASGLPVISTKHAGIKDVVKHGSTGYLVEEGDVLDMANYMVQILLDKKLASELGEAGYKNVLENYTMEKSILNLRKIIEQNI